MEQMELVIQTPVINSNLLTMTEASIWATKRVGRNVTPSNISYLVQYGRVKKRRCGENVCVSINDLENYYNSYESLREMNYKARLGDDINWSLSFSQVKESESTKHVHRLHPYKGKFIPQLVEYFIDDHTDNFKREVYFNKGDILLDPFSGSGTALVQANECGMHAIGVDISAFNALIGNCKVEQYDLTDLIIEINRISQLLHEFASNTNVSIFENELLQELNTFNNTNFPVPDYKYRLRQGEIDENSYGSSKEKEFLPIYSNLVKKYNIRLRQESDSKFIEKWFSQQIRDEIDFLFNKIKDIDNRVIKSILAVILSRTMRSCRATTHSDLATLIEPITTTYYCSKHGKMCKPLFSIVKWWDSYCKDTTNRIKEFSRLRTQSFQRCITGDSRNIDLIKEIKKFDPVFSKKVATEKIAGIFSSPPYVGMINYHEQHAYAYDLFGFKRSDDNEIGPLFKGKGQAAKSSYIDGISRVLFNCKGFLVDDYNIFLVANDKHNLYPIITENAGMRIVNTFKRPVLNRSEKDNTAYSETIFHIKEK